MTGDLGFRAFAQEVDDGFRSVQYREIEAHFAAAGAEIYERVIAECRFQQVAVIRVDAGTEAV